MTCEKRGLNTLLLGPTGTGKTTAIKTYIAAGVTPFVLCTEPGFDSVLDIIPDANLHWHYIPPASASWDVLIDSAKKINTLSFKLLAEMSGINKEEYPEFIEVLTTFNNFPCDRCGKTFGDISTWDNSRAIVVDSLSGLNIAAMNLVIGSKPTKSPADWGVAMDNLERLVQKLCMDTKCHLLVTGHIEREMDEVTGAVQLMPSTLGRKLAPKLSRFFDDVILCRREGSTFFWSTSTTNVDLKARNLPLNEKLAPDFGPLLSAWAKKAQIME